MSKGKSFLLSEKEHLSLLKLASVIQESKKWTQQWYVRNLLIGLKGEYAYSKHTDQPLNTTVFKNSGDGGIDFPDGAQVKTTTFAGTDKHIRVSKILPSVKKYILAYHNPSTDLYKVILYGEISRENFELKSYKMIDTQYLIVGVKDLDIYY